MQRRWVPLYAALAVLIAIGAVYGVRSLGGTGDAGQDTASLSLDGLDTGPAPTVGYVRSGVLHDDGERELDLRGLESLSAYAVLDEGVLVTGRSRDGDEAVKHLPANGDEAGVWRAGYLMFNEAVAVSADGERAAFVQGDGTPVLIEDGRPVELPRSADSDPGYQYPIAVLDDGSVLVHATGQDQRGVETWRVGRRGWEPAGLGITQVEAVTDSGLVAGTTEIIEDGDGACAGVADRDGTVLWKTCHRRLIDFSPDSRHVLGSQNAADSFGDNALHVYDSRTGDPVLRLTTGGDQTGIFQMRWEDDEHLLLVVGEQGERNGQDDLISSTWAVVRIGLDGSREYAVAPVDTRRDPHSPALVLPVQ